MGIELLRSFHDIEVNKGILRIQYPCTIRHLFKFLVDSKPVHEVQINMRRDVQREFL